MEPDAESEAPATAVRMRQAPQEKGRARQAGSPATATARTMQAPQRRAARGRQVRLLKPPAASHLAGTVRAAEWQRYAPGPG